MRLKKEYISNKILAKFEQDKKLKVPCQKNH